MKSKLLTINDQTFLEKTKSFFADLQLGMSSYQIINFVLNDDSFPLPDSKYHQAKLELYTRWQKVIDLDVTFKKNLAETKLIEAKQLKWKVTINSNIEHEYLEAEAQMELLEIETERLKTARLFLQKSVSETLREMRVFMNVVKDLESQLLYENKDSAEHEHWNLVQSNRA